MIRSAMPNAEVAEAGPRFQGILEKQSKIARSWKKYCFYLKDGTLTYVKSQQDKMMNSCQIDMSQVHTVRKISSRNRYAFEIVTKNRTHYLSAASSELQEKWIKLLHESMSWACRNSSTSSRSSSTGNMSLVYTCNSISSDEGRDSTRSSGYNSSSGRESENRPLSSRESGAETVMYNSLSSEGIDEEEPQSKHVQLRRLPLKLPPVADLYLGAPSRLDTSGMYSEVREPAGVDLSNINCVYANAGHMQCPPSVINASGVYESVHQPTFLPVMHIIQGYANVKRNPGPQPEEHILAGYDEEASDDDVFVESSRDSGLSSVAMRRSTPCQESEMQCSECEDDTSRRSSGPNSEAGHPSSFKPGRYSDPPPVKDLAYPRLELMHKTAFDEIRHFLANNRGSSEFYTDLNRKELDGRHIRALREYLVATGY